MPTDTELERLKKEVERLSAEADKRLAIETADERIAAWEKRRVAFVAALLAVFGIATYASLSNAVAEYMLNTVSPQIDREVRERTAGVSVQDPAIAELRVNLAEAQKALSDLSTDFSRSLKASGQTSALPSMQPPPPLPQPQSGFVFFGIRQDSGDWTERHFDIVGESNRPPAKDDLLRSRGPVNIRSGYITYTSSGWVNQPSVGILRKGANIRVDEVREVTPGFWWVSFSAPRTQ